MRLIILLLALLNTLHIVLAKSDDIVIDHLKGLEIQIDELTKENNNLRYERKKMTNLMDEQINTNQDLEERLAHLEKVISDFGLETGLVLNLTVEERVLVLEAQMSESQEEIAQLQEATSFLFDEISTLGDGQIIQDLRIFNVEEDTSGLDTRVETLEENGGGDISALEERVVVLETTTNNLGETIASVETSVEGLETADAGFDARITDLEDGSGGSGSNGSIAFRAEMTEGDVDSIPFGSTIVFTDLKTNVGDGYEPATGVFTVPPGGDGLYYFSTYYTVMYSEYAYIDLRVNGQAVCTVLKDSEETPGDWSNGGCSALVELEEGDEVQNVYWQGTDSTPLYEEPSGVYNGFSGFRI